MNLNVIYEDNHIIVCEKPAGILSQSGSMDKPDMLNLVKDYIKIKYDKPGNVYLGLVHRLDLNVGGVMVFARTSKAASRLSEEIRKHNFKKKYLAIVLGELEVGKKSSFVDYLEKDPDERKAVISDSKVGKKAELDYTCLGTTVIDKKTYSLVDIRLITGRFHQIRAQFAHHGYPLYGDTKYGEAKKDGNFFLGLYAYTIEFKHPIKDEIMKFEIMPEQNTFNEFESIIENITRR